jgi:pyruvate dehydrogenase E2 component (dihydrolipoamide acetyltransferase)
MVTGDMVEDVLKFKRLDGVDAALRKLRDDILPGGRQGASLRGNLADLRVPVRVVWGREDRIVPAAHGEGLPAAVEVTILDGAGHLAHMEKAKRSTISSSPG